MYKTWITKHNSLLHASGKVGDKAGDKVDDAVDDITGQGPAVIFLWDNLGPTNSSLSVPPAMIVYVTPHSSPSTVTVAIPLITGALSVKWSKQDN